MFCDGVAALGFEEMEFEHIFADVERYSTVNRLSAHLCIAGVVGAGWAARLPPGNLKIHVWICRRCICAFTETAENDARMVGTPLVFILWLCTHWTELAFVVVVRCEPSSSLFT